MRPYCRQLELKFASFAVLTPLPGTDLYEELNRLYMTAIPPAKGFTFLAKYPLREIPGTLAKSFRAYKGVGNAWRDYASAA